MEPNYTTPPPASADDPNQWSRSRLSGLQRRIYMEAMRRFKVPDDCSREACHTEAAALILTAVMLMREEFYAPVDVYNAVIPDITSIPLEERQLLAYCDILASMTFERPSRLRHAAAIHQERERIASSGAAT